jgi:ubiquitin C-terminal hydrolase
MPNNHYNNNISTNINTNNNNININNRNPSIKNIKNESENNNERNRNHLGSFNRNYSNSINNNENRNLPMINNNNKTNNNINNLNNIRGNSGKLNPFLHSSQIIDQQQQENKNFNINNNVNNLGNSNRINGGYHNFNNSTNEPTKLLYHHNYNSPSLNELPKSIKSPLNETASKNINEYYPYNNYNNTNNNITNQRTHSKNPSAVSRSSSRNLLSKENLNTNTNSPYLQSSSKSPIITTNSIKNNFTDSIINTNTNNNLMKYDISKKLVGLENLGNTCFMNTSLQCILHSDKFITRFLQYFENNKPLRSIPICSAFLNLIENYNRKNDKSSISPNELKSEIGRKHRCYSGYSQQDSQEFIRKLLDEISKELNIVTTKPAYKMLNANNEKKTKKELDQEYDNIFRERENSIIIDTFYGQSVSIFECMECNYESFSFCKFLDLPLLLEEKSSDQDLNSLMNKYFQSEKIQWESPCENKSCGKKTWHRKKLKLTSLPEILILSFQRYSNRLNRKNNCKISFKNDIDLNEYTDDIYTSGKNN